VVAQLRHRARIGRVDDDADVAELGDLLDVPNVAVPAVLGDDHPPGAGAQVTALDGLADVGAALGEPDGPVQAIRLVLELQGAGIAAERDPGVIDTRDEVVELRVGQAAGVEDLAEAAEVAALDVVGDEAAQAAAVDLGSRRGALLELAGGGTGTGDRAHGVSSGRFSRRLTSSRVIQPVFGSSAIL
jgi:hypothetical protein